MEPSRHRDVEYRPPAAAPSADERPGPSGAGPPLMPPGFGVPGSSPRAGRGRGRGRGPPEASGNGGRYGGRGPPRPGRGPPPPGMMGGGRGPPPPFAGGGRGGGGRGGRGGPPPPMPAGPPPGPLPSKMEAKLLRREEQRMALLKRQVAAMEVSATMLTHADLDLRDSILRGGPSVAPASSYEELPAVQHCYWADALLLDQAQLQAPSVTAPGVDHGAAMAAAMQLYAQPPVGSNGAGSVLLGGKLGNFAVDVEMASLLSSI